MQFWHFKLLDTAFLDVNHKQLALTACGVVTGITALFSDLDQVSHQQEPALSAPKRLFILPLEPLMIQSNVSRLDFVCVGIYKYHFNYSIHPLF